MKLLLATLFLFVSISAQAVDINWNIPNVEPASIFWAMNTDEVLVGWTSKFLSTGDFEWRIGAASGIPILALSYDVRNLEKIGAEVIYLWGDTSFIVSGFCGRDFRDGKVIYGANMILMQFNFY